MVNSRKILKIFILTVSLFVFSSSLAIADIGTAHIKKGSLSGGASNMTYWVDDSMNSLGFKGSVENGVKQWDNASTGVFITEVVNSSTASMKIYAGKGNLPPGTYGAATYWMLSGRNITPDEVTNGTNFQQGVIRFDLDNQNAAGFENVHRYKTSGHEVGHVLGLNHFEEPPGHSGNHWMKSGKIALEQPTSVDLAHLRTKWGW